jgi:hypothetical protein
MASDGTPVELQRLRQKARTARVCYDIFPVLICQDPDAPVDWFEIALHAEVDAREPLDGPERREAIAVLHEIAEFLAQRIPADEAIDLHLSPRYYTAQPALAGEPLSLARLFRSLSLEVCNLPPYLKSEEPPLLSELKNQLQQLEISRVEAAC